MVRTATALGALVAVLATGAQADDEVFLGTIEIGADVADTSSSYALPEMRSATKTDTPVVETPQALTVLTRKQFDDQNPQTVAQALEQGPMFFTDILNALGSRDGREIALELNELRGQGKLMRNGNGQYELGDAAPGSTGLTEDALHQISMDPNAKLQALSRNK